MRVALGAQRTHLLTMVFGQAAVLTGCGLAIGIVGAMLLTRLLDKALFGVRPADPVTYLAVAVVLGVVAVVPVSVPARRALRVDPAVALRYE